MPHIYREDDRFVHSYANHSSFQDWTVGLDGRVGMLWNVLQLSGSIESRKYWSNGIDFRHTQHSIGWDVAATFMYKNFTASVEFSIIVIISLAKFWLPVKRHMQLTFNIVGNG